MKPSDVLAAIVFTFLAILGAVISRGSQLSLLVLDTLGIEVGQGSNLQTIRIVAGALAILFLLCLVFLCRRTNPNR